MGCKLISLKMPDFLSALKRQSPSIQSTLQDDIQLNFDSQSSPNRMQWKTRRKYYSHPILNKTGAMKRNVRVVCVSKSDTEIDFYEISDVGYGGYHQYGTSRMPARPFLGLSDKCKGNILKILTNM